MIYVKLLGPTVVEVDGTALPEAALGGRLRQVLEILALNAGQPVPKEVLADQVWDGAPPPTYLGTLESYVCVLRKRLGLTGGRHSSLATRDRGYVLGGLDVEVDLHTFYALTNSGGRRGSHERVQAAKRALELVRGPLLAQEPYAAWAVHAREVFDRTLVESLVPVAVLANARHEYDSARHVAQRIIQHDPYCEAAWQQLIRANWLAGDRGEALHGYATLRQVLLEELGEQPSRKSHELYLAILRSQDDERQETQRQEVGLLLRLLRQTLESVPGVAVPREDAALVRMASGLLEQSGTDVPVLIQPAV